MLARQETGARHLDPKIRIVWALGAIIALFIIWIIASFASYLFLQDLFGIKEKGFYPFVILIILLAIFLPYFIWIDLEYRHFTFYLGEKDIIIKRGVISSHRDVIPYEKIQNISISRTILERFLNLATLHIETAAYNPKEGEGAIPAISGYKALVDEILEKLEATNRPSDSGITAGETAQPDFGKSTEILAGHMQNLVKEMKELREEIASEKAKRNERKSQ